MDGFHGFMWIGSGLISNYSRLRRRRLRRVRSRTPGSTTTTCRTSPARDDQCPVAYAVGANEADATNRLFNERYDNVFSDPSSIGWWHVTYILGCDPANETAL